MCYTKTTSPKKKNDIRQEKSYSTDDNLINKHELFELS